MRVCDLITEFLVRQGVDDVFMVAGGGSMFLTDGLYCNHEINAVPCHHEQAAALAAVAYAKYKGIGCAYVTTGCGGTNAVTGVLHAWQDGVNCFFISGQCRQDETVHSLDIPIRQLGLQEANIVEIVRSITKYSRMVCNANDILFELEKSLSIMKKGRGGPVWLDIPLDIQQAEIDLKSLRHYEDSAPETAESSVDVAFIIEKLQKSHRPVCIAGHGVRQAGATNELGQFLTRWSIPMVNSRLGVDLLPDTHPCNIGRIGNRGTRAANMTVQKADLIIAIGSRLSMGTTGYQYELFGENAQIIAIDIDEYEHQKNTVRIDDMVIADAKEFLRDILEYGPDDTHKRSNSAWLSHCMELKQKFRGEYKDKDNENKGLSMYSFLDELSDQLRDGDVIVTDTGSIGFASAQSIRLSKEGQRYIITGAQSEMGFALPGCVGVAVARGSHSDVIGLVGDGSLQMNIQEFQTIAHHGYPIKLFVWNNNSYCSIRLQQNGVFNGRLLGCDQSSGISFPDLAQLIPAYGLRYFSVNEDGKLKTVIAQMLAYEGPAVCEVFGDEHESVRPMVKINKVLDDGQTIYNPLHRMTPLIEDKELEAIMAWRGE